MKYQLSNDFKKYTDKLPPSTIEKLIQWIEMIENETKIENIHYDSVIGYPTIKSVKIENYKLGFRFNKNEILIDGIVLDNIHEIYF